ncbi:MAG: hypothetical protein IKS10_04185 [Lachnospiraceae bacterium]|nr:hypothetical protein [Lachnospiraceae bacterium]
MDKYEYEIKTEQIRKLILLKEYDTAKKIADGMKWGKEKNPRLLSEVAELYVMSGEYDDAIDLLLQAYDYAHPGRLILKRLVEVAILAKNYRNAAEYCEEFHDLAPRDTEYYLMRYKVDEAAGNVSVERRIALLERYTASEMSEEWKLRLAQLYAEAGRVPDCVKLCDEIIFLFCNGEYVIEAMELKQQYAPLDKFQQEKYDHREEYLQKYHEEQEAMRLQEEEAERENVERMLEKERKRAEKLGIVDTPKEEPVAQEEWSPKLPTKEAEAMAAAAQGTPMEWTPEDAQAAAEREAQEAAEAERAAAQQAAYDAAEERRKRLLEIALKEEAILTSNTPEVQEHKLTTMMEDEQSNLASNITNILSNGNDTKKRAERDLEDTLSDFMRGTQVRVRYDEDVLEQEAEEAASVVEETAQAAETVAEAAQETAEAAAEVEEAAEQTLEAAADVAEAVAQQAEAEAVEETLQAAEAVEEAAQETAEAATEVEEVAEEAIEETTDAVAETVSEVNDSVRSMFADNRKKEDTGFLTKAQKQALLNMVGRREEAPAAEVSEAVEDTVREVENSVEETIGDVAEATEQIEAETTEQIEAETTEQIEAEPQETAQISETTDTEEALENFDATYVKDAEALQEEPEVDFDKAQDEDILAEVSKNLNRTLELQEIEQEVGPIHIPGPEMPASDETYTNVFEGDIDEAAFEETYQNVMEQAALEEMIELREQGQEIPTAAVATVEATEVTEDEEAVEPTVEPEPTFAEEEPETPVAQAVRSQLGEISVDDAAKTKDSAADEVCFAITCDNEQKGLAYAIELLKRLPKESERPSKLARTTAEKLNENGLLVQEERLEDVLLVIEHAGQLSEELVNELLQFRKHYENAIVVIIDSAEGLRKLFARRPELGLIFVLRYEYEEKTADEWFEFMKEYAEALECVIAPNAEYLIKEYLQDRIDHDEIVFETLLKEIVDDAEHEADRFTVKNLFASAFGRKFNKDGWLILKARHF